jgi:hypothetical protein
MTPQGGNRDNTHNIAATPSGRRRARRGSGRGGGGCCSVPCRPRGSPRYGLHTSDDLRDTPAVHHDGLWRHGLPLPTASGRRERARAVLDLRRRHRTRRAPQSPRASHQRRKTVLGTTTPYDSSDDFTTNWMACGQEEPSKQPCSGRHRLSHGAYQASWFRRPPFLADDVARWENGPVGTGPRGRGG